jgi:hypothetical protein
MNISTSLDSNIPFSQIPIETLLSVGVIGQPSTSTPCRPTGLWHEPMETQRSGAILCRHDERCIRHHCGRSLDHIVHTNKANDCTLPYQVYLDPTHAHVPDPANLDEPVELWPTWWGGYLHASVKLHSRLMPLSLPSYERTRSYPLLSIWSLSLGIIWLSIHSRKLLEWSLLFSIVYGNSSSNKLNWPCAWSSDHLITEGSFCVPANICLAYNIKNFNEETLLAD